MLLIVIRITDSYQTLVQNIICKLLTDGPASPFYQALLDANIGADYSPGTGWVKWMDG